MTRRSQRSNTGRQGLAALRAKVTHRSPVPVALMAFAALMSTAACEEGTPGSDSPKPILTQPWPETMGESIPTIRPRACTGPVPHARAVFDEPNGVHGMLEVYQQADEAFIEGTIRGLRPGLHAIHVHENGVCEGPDFASAGGHFDPTRAAHGAPYNLIRHAGDLGNLTTNPNGVAAFSFRGTRLSATKGPTLIVGRTFIIHESADDMKSQPSGNAGARVACAVIVPVDRP